MSEVKEVILEIKSAMLKTLTAQVRESVEKATVELRNQIKTSEDGQKLHERREEVIQSFEKAAGKNFDALTGETEREFNVLDYGSLSLVEEDDLEAMIAMEGMIAHARNCDISQYLAFTTRLSTLFSATRIDESNNPMDPEQIGDAYREAMRPVGMAAPALLVAYRHFNAGVFHQLESVLEQGNAILVKLGVMPDLDMAARSREEMQKRRSGPRERSDPTERAFRGTEEAPAAQAAQTQQMFSMMQNLMHGMMSQAGGQSVAAGGVQPAGVTPGAATVPVAPSAAPGMMGPGVMSPPQPGAMIGGQKVELVASDKLISLLDKLQPAAAEGDGEKSVAVPGQVNLGQSIGALLEQEGDDKTVTTVDAQSADVINLITLLYDAIWDDDTVPIPVKELIGRTQLTALKIALTDSDFFDRDDHPARKLLNELATAGISWTEFDKLEQDPMYRKMHEVVEKLVDGFAGEVDYINDLLQEFQQAKKELSWKSKATETLLKDADQRKRRMEEVNRYALEKISERILSDDVPAFAREFLERYFQKFLVEVILREGPGGNSWRPIMNTIDVLLWTVQSNKSAADRDRFAKVNPRLHVNLAKALKVAGFNEEESRQLLERLLKLQEDSLESSIEPAPSVEPVGDSFEDWMRAATSEAANYEADLPEDDEHVLEVSKYPIGIWLEFDIDGEHSIRCTLAAKISTIDKYVFVNGQGVKVIEKSKLGLAKELKAGTVKVISESPLFDRAMESVIGKLRNAAEEHAEAGSC